MSSELNVLAHMLNRISESNRQSRDFTLDSLRDDDHRSGRLLPGLSHLRGRARLDGRGSRRARARHRSQRRRRNPAMESSLFDFFREVMLPRDPEDVADPRRSERRGGYPPADAIEARERLALRDEVPAVHRAGPGQGPRGHGVLPLQPAAVAQRGRRQIRIDSAGRSRSSTRPTRSGCGSGRSR